MALKFLNDGFFDGKVGIGTDSPDATLEPVNISATSDGDGSASDTLSGQDSILLSTKTGTFEETSGAITWRNSTRRRAMITGVNEAADGDGDILGLAFYTQGTDGPGDFFESMRIAHSGNVGIGTTNPLTNLHIATAGSTNTQAGISNSGTGGARLYMDAANGDFINSDYMTIGQNNDLSGSIEMEVSAGPFHIVTGSSNRLTVLQTGNVGIGATSPGAKLEITGSTPTAGDTTLHLKLPVGNVTAGTTEMGNILFSSTDASNGGSGSIAKISTIAGNGSNAWIGQGRPTDLAFFTQPIGDTATLVEAMRINQNGNVGIGTNNPFARLDVKAPGTDIAGQIIVGGLIDGGTDNVAFGVLNFANINVANTQTNDVLASISGEKPDSSNRGELVFSTSNETAPVERMRIDKDGNVGIGTTNPLAKLDILKNDDTVYNPAADDGQRGVGPTIQLNNNSTTTNTFGQIMYDSDSSGQAVARIVFLDAGNASSAMAFVTENGEQKGERMRIAADGNVGVGETDPGEKLDVKGGNIRLVDASAGLIFTSPNGTLWKQTISNTGVPVYTDVSP